GGVVGSAAAPRLARSLGMARLLPSLLVLTSGECAILVAAKLSPQAARVAGVAAAMLLGGVLTSAYMVLAATLRQMASAPEIRGRVAASTRFFTRGAMPIGAVLGGALGTAANPTIVLAACSLGQLMTGCWCWRRRGDIELQSTREVDG